MRVLIVEDDDAVRLLLERVLLQAGVEVDAVASGAEARARAATATPDVLVADVLLGDGDGDGIALARVLAHDVPGLRVILMTGSDVVEGVDWPVLNKPFDLDELVRLVTGDGRRR